MSGTLDLWDRLGKTDPDQTKQFSRAGGFKGTAIKPIWSFKRMTEEFGPCGIGWGINQPTFQVVNAGDDVLVYCTVSVWHQKAENVVFGVGGDKVSSKNKNGVFTDDEAFKKAFTDAVTNALKLIGVGADVHMGLFDDNKYVSYLREEKKAEAKASSAPTAAELDRHKANEEKADKAVIRAVEALEPLDGFGRGKWISENPKAVEILKWVKANFPNKMRAIEDLGVEV